MISLYTSAIEAFSEQIEHDVQLGLAVIEACINPEQ